MCAAYKEQSSRELVEDLHRRKEFAQLYVPPGDEDFRGDIVAGMRTHQHFVRIFANPNTPNTRVHLMHSAGCHARGTMIATNRGNIRVENIKVGDFVARPFGQGFAKVSELHRGREMMYRITPRGIDGAQVISYIVNEHHIMYVCDTVEKVSHIESLSTFIDRWRANEIQWKLEYYRNGNSVFTHFNIERVDIDDYFGFAIDSRDGLFLGSDGLILHNSGKCLGRGTMIMTRDRGSVAVESLKVGDTLIDDIGGFPQIMSLAHGFDTCWRVQISDMIGVTSFVCNDAHILTVADREGITRDVGVRRVMQDLHNDDSYWRSIRIAQNSQRTYFGAMTIVRAADEPLEYFGFTLTGGRGRFLLANGVLTHNTYAALAVAQEHIKMYRYICRGVNWREPDIITPSVFVIAFSGRHSFIGDLLKYPELGYITVAELELYRKLMHESVDSEESYRKFIEFGVGLRKRITSKSRGGFYKFMGYDEFANRLFGATVAQINAIIAEARAKHELWTVTLERAIDSGRITVSADLLARLENSLIICDEIHNTYNSQSINNRGVALQYALSRVRSARFLSLSATPINSAPAEVADFINYFVEPEDYLRRDDLFNGREFASGAIDRINDALRGHVSFLYDFDDRSFPARIDDGSEMMIGDHVLPYLRFVPCKMSPFFLHTLREFYRRRSAATGHDDNGEDSRAPDSDNVVDIDDDIIGISQHAYSLFDIALPNPTSDEIGLYDSTTTFGLIHGASAEWKTKIGISTKSYANGSINTFNGSFLRGDNLAKYSAKYSTLIEMLRSAIVSTGACKMMIYHERVRMSGVILIREILRENGIIGFDDDATARTLCAICGETRESHGDADHTFRALRFAIMYSEMEVAERASIVEHYESVANLHGEWCSILVGSRIIRESFNFTAVRHMFILSLPTSIAQLIQVMGRCVRRGSHTKLAPEERNVRTHILVNVGEISRDGDRIVITQDNAIDSPEPRRYDLKLSSYLVIQQIEREIARNAVDAGINRNIITRPLHDSLGFLTYDEVIRFTLPSREHLRVDTFFAYGYGAQEIQYTIEIIKKLFHIRGMWREKDLWDAIHSPPFGVWTNPRLILDSSITIALAFLTSSSNNVVGAQDRTIRIDGVSYSIVVGAIDDRETKGELIYVLAPIIVNTVAGVSRTRCVLDVETFLRNVTIEPTMNIPIARYESGIIFEESIIARLREKYASIGAKKLRARIVAYSPFLTDFSSDYQRIIVRRFVEDRDFRAQFSDLYAFLASLRVFVYYGYAMKYRDVARRISEKSHESGESLTIQDDEPIGFTDGTVVHIWQPYLREWTDIGRSALNLHVIFNENDVMVGIFRQFPYAVKFQLRIPLHKLRVKTGVDKRTIARGSVCMTYPREHVEKIARNLGVELREIRGAETTGTLCDLVKHVLIEYEMEERKTMRSLVKFIYGWWDVIPSAF